MKRALLRSFWTIRRFLLPVVLCLALGQAPLQGADADNDGIDDAWETAHGLDPANPADGLLDPDGDGLANLEEFILGTDPHVADTDGDTVSDGTEADSGMDPLVPALEGPGYRYEERVAEDAEDGATTGWAVVAGTGSTLANAVDTINPANRVISFATEGATGEALFRLALSPAEQRRLKLSWRLNFTSGHTVYVSCQTSLGHRYLAYHSADSVQSGGEYVRYAIGSSTGINQWATFHRDLVADLAAGEPTAELLSIDSIYVRGVGQIDDIVLSAYPDADRDLIPDTIETAYGLDPNSAADATADPDQDGLTSLQEFYLGTSPVAADTDGDGLNDGDELLTVGTDPLNPDTDGDTVDDGTELACGMDPLAPALAGPGYSYDQRVIEDAEDGDALGWDLWDADPYGEAVNVADPDDPTNRVIQFQSVYGTAHRIYVLPYDTRKDVIQWRMRFSGSYYFLIYCRTSVGNLYIRYYAGTALSQVGSDPGIGIGNGLASGHWVTVRRNLVADLRTLYPDADLYEVRAFVARGGGYVDDICLLAYPDADRDLIPDTVEVAYGLDPNDASDASADLDGDGLLSLQEFYLGTDPLSFDTDSDGLSDGEEVMLATDPLDPDTDGDTVTDGTEVDSGMDPLTPALAGNGYRYEERVAEDAEDGTTTGWTVVGGTGSAVANAVDTADPANRIIAFTTEGATGDALFRLVLSPAEQRRFKLSWRINFGAGYVVYVSCQTSLGHRFLTYHSANSVQSGGEYIRYALGTSAGVTGWGTFHRDLVGDLAAGEPTAVLQSIDSIYLRGVGQVDDIVLSAYPDADHDLIPDTVETAYGLDPDDAADASADPDGDGLTSLQEFYLGTSPVAADTDGDGLSDGSEVGLGTDPLDADTDNDDLSDGDEVARGTDPFLADTDGDTLADGDEVALGTNPLSVDTDGDTLSDGGELALGTDPTVADTDGDGLDDGAELGLGTDPLDADTDDDALADGREVVLGTDPLVLDTDGDTIGDGDEVASGMDPLVAAQQGGGYLYDVRMIEDAEDGDALGWDLWDADPYGEAASVVDPDDPTNRAIQFQSVYGTAHRLWLSPYETRKTILQWRMRFSGNYYFYAYCRTSVGNLYIRYHAGTDFSSVDTVDPSIGIGSDWASGHWLTVRRDLVADLRLLHPDADLYEVRAFVARGGGYVDDICLLAYQDADHDLLPDSVETAAGLDPADPSDAAEDSDGDGLTFLREFITGTDPLVADTDADGLDDGAERAYGTNPLLADTDGDTLADGDEVTLGTNPLSTDTDGDTLSDSDEIALGTSPVLADTDGDALSDSEELTLGTDPLVADTDGDGLNDGAEIAHGTDPLVGDTDGDGLTDGDEVARGTNPLSTDTDGDTLSDSQEVSLGMDPLTPALVGNGYLYEERVAEDAEDGDTAGWTLPYADPPGEVLNTVDTTDSTNRVISFTTEGSSGDALYRLVLSPAEQRRFKLSWRLNFTSGNTVYVSCQTSLGHRFLAYYSSDSVQSEGEYIRYATGSGTGVNEWVTFHRDLVADLAAGEPAAELLSIDSIYIRGVGQIDDIVFSAYPDADRDLIPDTVETAYGLDPDDASDASADPDGDGLTSLQEFHLGTSPVAGDSDGDGLGDGDELLYTDTDPLNPDEDGDGIPDGQDTELPGLAAAYYAGEFSAVPAFGLINHYRVGRVSNLAWPHEEGECVDSGRSVAVAAIFAGSLQVPEDGTYEFKVTCNDGVRLLVDGNAVLLLQKDGYLGYATVPLVRTFSLALAAGSHEFRAEYFQLRGDHSLVLAWRASANDEFATVPASAFSFDPAWLLAMAATIDTDGDGLYDWEETALGTSATTADSDGDGLSDAEEVRIYHTDPLVADTDSDGVSDYLEVTSSLTDPLVAEFGGTETVLATVAGSSFAGLVGTWSVDNGTIAARDRQGTVSALLPVAAAGVYVLEVAGTQDNDLSSIGEFVLDGYVDSCYVGRVVLDAPAGTVGTGRYYLPWLAAGDHSLAIQWRNTATNSFVRLVSVSLLEVDGRDTDGDGIADWIETRDALTQYDVSEATVTKVSPYFIEGTAAHVDLVDLRSSYVPDDTTLATDANGCLVNAVQHGVGNGWYTNLPLSPEGTTDATLTVGNGIRSQNFSVLWEPTDIFSTDEITLRIGDSLLLAAYVGNGNANGKGQNGGNTNPNGNGPVTIGVEGNSFATTPGGTVPYQFLNHGTVVVDATFGNGNGNHQEGQLVVHVVGGILSGRPAAFVGCQRRWDNPNLTDDVVVQCDSHLSMVELATNGAGRNFTILIHEDRPAHVVARLGEDGPIVSGTTVDAITFAGSADTGFALVKEYSDGSQLIEGRITLGYVPEDLEFHIHIFVGGVTFEDGTIDKVFTAADFSETGEIRFRFIRAEDGYTAACHYIQFYQDGVLIKLGP